MTLLTMLLACNTLEGACEDLGFGADACTEPLVPLAGPWVANPDANELCGLDARDFEQGWTIEHTDDGFSLAPPEGDGAACAQDGASFVCDEATGVGDLAITASGTLGSRSTADVALHLVGDACDVTTDVSFMAAWKALAPETGACPRSYDDFGSDPDARQVSFTVDNRSDQALSVFVINDGSDSLTVSSNPNSIATTSTSLNGWVALATDWGAENCVYMFQVREADQVEIYDGE